MNQVVFLEVTRAVTVIARNEASDVTRLFASGPKPVQGDSAGEPAVDVAFERLDREPAQSAERWRGHASAAKAGTEDRRMRPAKACDSVLSVSDPGCR